MNELPDTSLREKKVLCMDHKITLWTPTLDYVTFVLRYLVHKDCNLKEVEVNFLF